MFYTQRVAFAAMAQDTEVNATFDVSAGNVAVWEGMAAMDNGDGAGIRGRKFVVVKGGNSLAANFVDTDNADEGWIGGKASNDLIKLYIVGTTTIKVGLTPDFNNGDGVATIMRVG